MHTSPSSKVQTSQTTHQHAGCSSYSAAINQQVSQFSARTVVSIQFPLVNSVTFAPTVFGRIIVKAELSIDEFSAFAHAETLN
jgi:hypothetical protein